MKTAKEDANKHGKSCGQGKGIRATRNSAMFKGPPTPKEVFKVVQEEIREYPPVLRANRRGQMTSEAARNAFEVGFGERFDLLYRPYVYDRLLRMGFVKVRYKHCADGAPGAFETEDIVYPKNQIDAEDMYQEFRKKFLESIILTYDFDHPRVGRGAFRNYVKRALSTILQDKLDLVEKVDRHGKVIYTDEPRRHKNGKIMRDEAGNILYKPVLIPRLLTDQEKVDKCCRRPSDSIRPSMTASEERAREDRVPAYVGPGKGTCGSPHELDEDEISEYVLRLVKVAYLLTLDHVKKHERKQWRSKTIEAVFERFEDEQTVMAKLCDNNEIKNRGNLDNIKSLFYKKWYEKWWRMWSPIFTGPKVKVVDGRFIGRDKSRERYVWRPLKPAEEISAHVAKMERECEAAVGKERMRELDANYKALLLRIVEIKEQSHKEEE